MNKNYLNIDYSTNYNNIIYSYVIVSFNRLPHGSLIRSSVGSIRNIFFFDKNQFCVKLDLFKNSLAHGRTNHLIFQETNTIHPFEVDHNTLVKIYRKLETFRVPSLLEN